MIRAGLAVTLAALLQADAIAGLWNGQYTGGARVENLIQLELRLTYSYLNATMGSTRVALRAGT